MELLRAGFSARTTEPKVSYAVSVWKKTRQSYIITEMRIRLKPQYVTTVNNLGRIYVLCLVEMKSSEPPRSSSPS